MSPGMHFETSCADATSSGVVLFSSMSPFSDPSPERGRRNDRLRRPEAAAKGCSGDSPREREDVQLLQRIGRGDQEAFRRFYCRWSSRLDAVLRHLSRRGAQSEDLLQEVFLSVWRRAASYDPSRGDVGGWLYIICRNKHVDHLRRQRPADPAEVEPAAALPEGRDARLDLERALAELRQAERKALRLAFFGGLTHEETALRLGVPLGTLKSRIRLGLRKMARSLRQYDPST